MSGFLTEESMTDKKSVRAIEERMLNAWPAVETLIAGDWFFRFAHGYSKRANSATTIRDGAAMDKAMLGHWRAQAERWEIAPTLRLTPLCDPAFEARLEAEGFSAFDTTCGMIRELSDGPMSASPPPRREIRIEKKPSRDWIAANAAAYGGLKADATKLAPILDRIRPAAAFATVIEDGAPVGFGIGVCERGMIGLQDIAVAAAMRGRGVARALTGALLDWGRRNDARFAYLHVLEENAPARALYRALGFSDAYRMWHRMIG